MFKQIMSMISFMYFNIQVTFTGELVSSHFSFGYGYVFIVQLDS